jgi:hypothetical protein
VVFDPTTLVSVLPLLSCAYGNPYSTSVARTACAARTPATKASRNHDFLPRTPATMVPTIVKRSKIIYGTKHKFPSSLKNFWQITRAITPAMKSATPDAPHLFTFKVVPPKAVHEPRHFKCEHCAIRTVPQGELGALLAKPWYISAGWVPCKNARIERIGCPCTLWHLDGNACVRQRPLRYRVT